MGSILDKIMATKREEVKRNQSKRSESLLMELAQEQGPTRGFYQKLKAKIQTGSPGIIAEIKRASPSKGRIHPGEEKDFNPGAIAQGYEKNGAATLSCLTDQDYFQGSDAFLAPVRQQSHLAVLRKDFLYDPYQVIESRALGADAILLIMAVLDRSQAMELESAAREMGMDVLVEVHDEKELDKAHDLKTPLMGINNRNLNSFQTSLDHSIRLAERIEAGRMAIAESGIETAEDIFRLQDHGIQAFLIGSAFMKHPNPGAALAEMLETLGTPGNRKR